ncbi:hypothetical protein B0I37DRAFT_358029 [Chaetomium sp. MPI-CAGE-AT-0009]|nr:hypothetical protein B0I37DRAFT_358029 [Chaetomium sp. MPI-CAGE-AT-0009]
MVHTYSATCQPRSEPISGSNGECKFTGRVPAAWVCYRVGILHHYTTTVGYPSELTSFGTGLAVRERLKCLHAMQSGCYRESRTRRVDSDRDGGLGGRYEGSATTTFGGNGLGSDAALTFPVKRLLLELGYILRQLENAQIEPHLQPRREGRGPMVHLVLGLCVQFLNFDELKSLSSGRPMISIRRSGPYLCPGELPRWAQECRNRNSTSQSGKTG